MQGVPTGEVGYRRVPGAKEGVTRAIRRRTQIWLYNVLDWRRRYRGRWKRTIVLFILQSGLIFVPYALSQPKTPLKTLGMIALAILVANALIVAEVNAQSVQKVGELKNDRKIRTANIIDTLAVKFPAVRLAQFEALALRREILLAITSSVASSLGMDPIGFMASLVVKNPAPNEGGITVIARSDDSRRTPISYPKDGMVAWDAIERRQVEVTGDVTAEFEGFASRAYRSVISLPIVVQGQAIGAVNVDHRLKFLFDERGLLFQTNLRPYLRLIALSLTNTTVADSVQGEADPQ
jgi:hypothetical protein